MVPVAAPRTWELACRAAGHGPGTAAIAGHGSVQVGGYGRRPLSMATRRPVRNQQRSCRRYCRTLPVVAVRHAVQAPDTAAIDYTLQMDEETFRGFYNRTSGMLWAYIARATNDASAADAERGRWPPLTGRPESATAGAGVAAR